MNAKPDGIYFTRFQLELHWNIFVVASIEVEIRKIMCNAVIDIDVSFAS